LISVYLSDAPINAAVVSSASRDQNPRVIDVSGARTCREVEEIISEVWSAFDRDCAHHIVIPNLLDGLYDSSVPTREAARILGRIKLKLRALVGLGAQITIFCQRRKDAGTRSHFWASLCASADEIHIVDDHGQDNTEK
jgi:hypothetical protein